MRTKANTSTGTVRCECGRTTGEPCAWSGPLDDTIVIEWMPDHLRASHEAAGGSGAWPANGAERLRVHWECANWIMFGADSAPDDASEPWWATSVGRGHD